MKPVAVTGLEMAFGPEGGIKKLLPPMSEIPEEFKRDHNPWCSVVSRWFFGGLTKEEVAAWAPKEDIDKDMALRHVKAALGSFEPKHEHKEAGCAYLLSLWFEAPAKAVR